MRHRHIYTVEELEKLGDESGRTPRLKESVQYWYWYDDFPEDIFVEYFVPRRCTVPVCELDFVKVANMIDKGDNPEADTQLASIAWEMYKRGYVTLILRCLRQSDSSIIVVSKEYDTDKLHLDDSFIALRYPYFEVGLNAYFTKKGKEWFNSIKEKYTELFEECRILDKEIYNKGLKEVPPGYTKHGVRKHIYNDEHTEYDEIIEEIE